MRVLTPLIVATAAVTCCTPAGSQPCSNLAAIPLVEVDGAALAEEAAAGGVDSDAIEICLDGHCLPMGTSDRTAPSIGVDEAVTVFAVEGDHTVRTLAAFAIDSGDIVAGPTDIDIPRVFPNGEHCGQGALQGRVVITAEGTFELRR